MKEFLCRSVYIDVLKNMGDKKLQEPRGEFVLRVVDMQLDLPCQKQGSGKEEGTDGSTGSGAPLALTGGGGACLVNQHPWVRVLCPQAVPAGSWVLPWEQVCTGISSKPGSD